MTILEWIGILALGYFALCIIFYYIQELFLFHPEKLDSDFKYQFEQLLTAWQMPDAVQQHHIA